MKYCVNCETESVVLSKKYIHIGQHKLLLEVENCKKCSTIFLSPKDQEKIDEWGNTLTTAAKEAQPYFTDEVYGITCEYAKKYGLKWSQFVKLCTAFYLFKMTKDKNFKEVREILLTRTAEDFSSEERKTKHSVSISYRMFKQLELFSDVWSIREPNVIEEAVLCCIGLLDFGQEIAEFEKMFDEKKAQLQEYVVEHATTA